MERLIGGKIYRFLNRKYNKENNGFLKKIGILK